jgi:hypothetical protein
MFGEESIAVPGMKTMESCEMDTWLARLFDPLDNDTKVSSAVPANIL